MDRTPPLGLLPWLTAAAIWVVILWGGVLHSGPEAPASITVIARTN